MIIRMYLQIAMSRRGCVTFDAVDCCTHTVHTAGSSNGTNAITDFELTHENLLHVEHKN